MFHKIDYKHQQKPILLTKGQSTYNKLEKEMNKPPSDYNAIKRLVESDDNSIKNVDSKISKNTLLKLIPHKKK